MRKLIILSLLALGTQGQNAKLVILERRDTQSIKESYSKFQQAKKEWEAQKQSLAGKYVPKDSKGKLVDGWTEVEFSVDFRAMVPVNRNIYSNSWTTMSPSWGNSSLSLPVTTGTGELSTTINNQSTNKQ